jgi:hypothetical protein
MIPHAFGKIARGESKIFSKFIYLPLQIKIKVFKKLATNKRHFIDEKRNLLKSRLGGAFIYNFRREDP